MNHNMLVDYLPETVEIEGTEYAIETNFRTFILFEMMMQDPDLSARSGTGISGDSGESGCCGGWVVVVLCRW